jgi:hypothetical protein
VGAILTVGAGIDDPACEFDEFLTRRRELAVAAAVWRIIRARF